MLGSSVSFSDDYVQQKADHGTGSRRLPPATASVKATRISLSCQIRGFLAT
jgi:hypothetical protein